MKYALCLFLLFLSLFPLSGHGKGLSQGYGFNKLSFSKPISACYRWVTQSEMQEWMSGEVILRLMHPQDALDRAGMTRLTYCWTNPVTALMGGPSEFYGSYLMRIDLVEDAVIFDRNKREYLSLDSKKIVPKKMRRKVSTEIVYGNYTYMGTRLFQEYLIRSKGVIKSWTFNDEDLKKAFWEELSKLEANTIAEKDYHFFNYVNKPVLRAYYLNYVDKKAKELEEFWKQKETHNLTIKNPNQRAALP